MPFLSSLRVEDHPDGWRLTQPLTYCTHDLPAWQGIAQPGSVLISVPRGFITDLASIPAPFEPWFDVNGPSRRAAVLHDYLYRRGLGTRVLADLIFRQAMADCGVSWWRRWSMWSAVRIGGWAAWRGN